MTPGLTEYVRQAFFTDEYKIIATFPMLHAGWECDNVVVLIEIDDSVYAIGTDHGRLITLTKKDLLVKITEYSNTLNETISAFNKIRY